jgi:hypothetical protein
MISAEKNCWTTPCYVRRKDGVGRREAMKLGRLPVIAQSVFAVLIGIVPASAQEKTSWLSNPFEVASGIDSVPMQGGGFNIEAVTFVTPPRLSTAGGSARSHWEVGYQPEFEFRFGNGTRNTWNHSADGAFGHLFSRHTKVNFGDSFVTSSDPARTFTDNIFVMPQGNFLENAGAMTLTHESSTRTTLNIRFDSTFTKMSSEAATDAAILNENGIAGTAGISQRFGRHHKLAFSYSLLQFRTIRFENVASVAQLAATIPIVQAGIARYAQALSVSVSRSSSGPIGLGSVGNEPRATPAPDPSLASLSDASNPLLSVVTPVSTATTACAPESNVCSSTASLQFLDRPFHVVGTNYTYSNNSGFLIEVSGGAMRDRELSYLLGVQVQQSFERVWFGGQYQRFLSFFEVQPFQETPLAAYISVSDGMRPNSVFSDLTGRVGGRINRKTQLETSFSLSSGTANFVVYDLKSAIARARVSYELSDRLSLFADAESFYENIRDVGSTRFSRQRYVGGILVRFSQAAVPVRKTGN